MKQGQIRGRLIHLIAKDNNPEAELMGHQYKRARKGGVKPEMHRKRQMERAKSLCSIQALLCAKKCGIALNRTAPPRSDSQAANLAIF